MITATAVPTLTLNNGMEMPVLGFGVYQIPPEDTGRAVSDARRGPSMWSSLSPSTALS